LNHPPLEKALGRLLRDLPASIHAENFIINVTVINMPGFTNVTISGGSIGALNASGIQTVHSIDMKIGELLKDSSSQDFANALTALTEAIGSSTSTLTEQQRVMALQQLEALGQQATTPSSQRNAGIVSALVNTLANVCAGAGGLAAAWQMWGPAIGKFFGL
jgi:hypothetical protein